MSRRAVFVLTLAAAVLAVLLLAPVALAAGNDVGHNLGSLLRKYAGEVYGGIVATVGLLYATVRRRFGAAAGLIAGAVLAVTPVAALMFRFNNPDALLVLCLVASAYAVMRALDGGSTRWLVLAGALVGVGFLAKMLQALLVVPGFGLVYLCCAPVPVRRRIGQLLASGLALVVTAGWWVTVVALTPASHRPYVGGSTNNSILNLIFGYNGFGRLTGNETGTVSAGQEKALFDRLTCPREFRLFTRAEGAEGHCEGMAPIIFWTAAFDWLDHLLTCATPATTALPPAVAQLMVRWLRSNDTGHWGSQKTCVGRQLS